MKKKLQFLVVSALLWGGAATAQAEIYSGDCSDPYPLHGKANVTWTLDTETGVLEISGTGSMEDYDNYNNYAPWDELQSFITSVTIGEGVTHIGWHAFSGCTGLMSATISSSVTSIGDWAFSSCGKLRSVTIPASVTTIGERAFWGDRLTTVVAYNPTPVDIAEKNVFHEDGYYYSYFVDCTLYVPAESVEAYGAAEGWKCKTILPIDESSAITEIRQDNADGHVTVYNLQGVPVLETDDAADLKMLQNGAYIVNGKTMIIAR